MLDTSGVFGEDKRIEAYCADIDIVDFDIAPSKEELVIIYKTGIGYTYNLTISS
jgi:hypothetical protein